MSLLRSIRAQLGLMSGGNESQNHFFDGSVANQLTLKRGVPDAPGATVMQVVDGVVSFPGTPVVGAAFKAERSTSQTGSVSGTPLKVICNVEIFDADNSYDPATGRFQPTVAGYYQLGCSVEYGGSAGNSVIIMQVFKNGAGVTQTRKGINVALQTSSEISDLVFLNGTTDYAEFFWTQNTGATLNILAGTYCYGFLARKA